MADELTELVMPEVEALGVGRGETLDGGRAAQLHAHQLVSDPQGGREVHVQLDPLAHHGRDTVLGDAEVAARLEPGIIDGLDLRHIDDHNQLVPVEVDEGEAVPGVLRHLLAVVLLTVLVLAHPDLLPVLPSPGDGRPGHHYCHDHHHCHDTSHLGVPVASQWSVTARPSVARVSPLLVSSTMFGGTGKINTKINRQSSC